MNLHWIWQTILIFIVGVFLLRISGRKSISQMTIPETVIMIAIGTLLIQPVTGMGIGITFGVATILVITLLITEVLQLKSDRLETLITGKALPVIENGMIHEKNLRKLRLTVDKLEARLRQAGIANITDLQYATIEINGRIGYQLKPEKQPATKEDLQKLIQTLSESIIPSGGASIIKTQEQKPENLFTEVIKKDHFIPPPQQLQ